MEIPLMTGGGGEQKIVKSNGNNNSVGAKSSVPKIIEMEINGRVNPCNRDVKRPTKSRRLVNSKSSCPTTQEVMSFNDGNLPDWFLIEVLCRLPIKSIFRFKYVSRCWNSIISHPSFRCFYISRVSASASALPWGFLLKRMHVEGSMMANFPTHKLLENKISDGTLLSSPHASVLALPNSHKAKGPLYYIKAADNGVVLYGWFDLDRRSFNDVTEYFICNPITKQWLAIPDPKHCTRRASFGFITQVDEEGILRSFKLVLVHCPCTSKIQNFLEFEVFSSETGKWVEHIVHSPCTVRVSHNKKAFVMEGNLHWDDCELGVIAYDPYNSPDKFRIIEFPHVDKEGNKSRYMCGGHLGRLKYFEVGRMFKPQGFSHLKIWALENYSSNNWYLQHIVRKEEIMVDNNLGSSPYVNLASFHPYDEDIVYLEWSQEVVSYNTRTKRVEALGGAQQKTLDTAPWSCLVLPIWPVSIPTSLYLSIGAGSG